MRFSIEGLPVHPHIKLTKENFPRPLATWIVDDDGDEYFGAFLNRTNVRILIDFLNRTFRLRSCAIAIDGSFQVPCTQYYSKRCIAPCVASLCDAQTYLEIVELERLFLRNDRELFLAAVTRKIEIAAESLDFETAAFFRDMLQSVEAFWSNSRYQVWLDDTVDTFEVDEADNDSIVVIVLSQRGRRTLGELVFAFPKMEETPDSNAVKDVIRQLYRYHVPREIRVPYEFRGRKALAAELMTKIVVTGPMNRRVTAERAIDVTKARLRLANSRSAITLDDLRKEIRDVLALKTAPDRIEAYDVAHISATGFAAAASAWSDEKYLTNEYRHWLSNQTSELDTLRAFLIRRFTDEPSPPDLILIDGGRSHLNAAIGALEGFSDRPAIAAIVKPRGKHSSISHILLDGGGRIDFDPDLPAFRLIQRLRDDAHDLSNATHRLSRDMMHFYELAAVLPSLNERQRQDVFREFGSIRQIVAADDASLQKKFGDGIARAIRVDIDLYEKSGRPAGRPLIVPIRFVETDGAADDLIPIETR